MKRSEINAALREMEAMLREYRFALPDFCHFTPEEWNGKGHEYDEVRDNALGWDITDYGLGRFDEVGFSLITLRNGNHAMPERYPKTYAEKIMMLYPGQLSWSIAVPLIKGNSIKSSPYADKTLIAEKARGFVLLRNQLAMKGVPQSVLDAEFEVSAKAILTDYGALKVNVGADAGEYTVYVPKGALSQAIGQKKSNLIYLAGKGYSCRFKESDSLVKYQVLVKEMKYDT